MGIAEILSLVLAVCSLGGVVVAVFSAFNRYENQLQDMRHQIELNTMHSNQVNEKIDHVRMRLETNLGELRLQVKTLEAQIRQIELYLVKTTDYGHRD